MKSLRQSPPSLRLRQYATANRASLTLSERILWERLKCRQLGVQFRRQVPLLGCFIVDFLAPSVGLVVEVDGAYHSKQLVKDARRDRKLRRAGVRVLRLPAELVLAEVERAVEMLRQHIG